MNETSKNTYRIIAAVVVVLIIAAAAFYQYKHESDALKSAQDSQAAMASTTPATGTSTSTVTVETTNGQQITAQIQPDDASTTALENAGPEPSLTRPITFASTTQPSVAADLTTKIETTEGALQSDPTNFADWINLGQYRLAAGDYIGAEQAYTYAGKLYPTNYVSFADLGDLYSYYLKNDTLAEANLLEAIANGPTQINLYITTSQFYTDFLDNNVKAKAIIEQGLTANPNNPTLEQFLSTIPATTQS